MKIKFKPTFQAVTFQKSIKNPPKMLHQNQSKVSVVALNLCQCGCETMAVADSEGQVI